MTPEYDIHLDDKFGKLSLIDLAHEAAAHEPWFNQTLTTVNDSVVRLGVIDGDFHWHKHDATDEFFLVLDGVFEVSLREDGAERTVSLRAGDIFVVPKGTEHKPSSPGGAILMFEPSGTVTTGDRHEGEIPGHVDRTTGHELG